MVIQDDDFDVPVALQPYGANRIVYEGSSVIGANEDRNKWTFWHKGSLIKDYLYSWRVAIFVIQRC